MSEFKITLEMSADDVLSEMNRLLAVEFSDQERLNELVVVIAQLDETLSAVQESLTAIESNRPMEADISLLGKWTTEKTSAELLAGTLSDKSTDHKAELAELQEQRRNVKRQIFERFDGVLFTWKMEQQRAKNAELSRIEAELRDVQSNYAPYAHAVHLELAAKQMARSWIKS